MLMIILSMILRMTLLVGLLVKRAKILKAGMFFLMRI